MAGGRPTTYKKEFCEQATNYCLLGATDEDMAKFFGVALSTLYKWKLTHKEFSEAIKAGKSLADGQVAKSLYHRACGYSHAEDKVFNNNGEPLIVPTVKHYAPDPTAIIFWLTNRQRALWKRNLEEQGTGDKDTAEALREIAAKLPG